MSVTYTYYVNSPVPGDIATRVSTLQSRLNIDLDISQDPTSVTYSGITQIVSVVYSSALTKNELIILENLFETCIAQLTPGNQLDPRPNDLLERVSFAGSGPPTVNHDVRSDYQPGSMVIDSTKNIAYTCYKNTFGAAVWKRVGNSVTSRNFTFDGNSAKGASTSSTSYVVFCAFEFDGTDNGDGMSNAYAVCYGGAASTRGQFRVQDITNNVTLGESADTFLGTTTYTKVTISSFSNLPTGAAWIELQFRRPSGSNSIFVRSAVIDQ